MTDKEKLDWILSCRDEAENAKTDRMSLNKDNYDTFHLKHDFSHKVAGQSQEVLSKQSMAVETNKSFFQQALVDTGDWWKAEASYPDADMTLLVRPHEITKLTNLMLEKSYYFSHVGNSVESAMLASLAISKIDGCLKDKPRFVSRRKGRGKGLKRWVEKIENKTWEPHFKCIRAENFYPDPSGEDLYVIEDMWVDFRVLQDMADYDDDFDSAAIDKLPSGGVADADEDAGKARETGQNTTIAGHRRKIKLTEFWGDILDKTSGEVIESNVQAIIANDTTFVLKPRKNPLWHQARPYVYSPLMEVANSVWHKALMDAPTKHNRALVEMYNLVVDAGMKQVNAISQLRKDWLDNPAQVSEGIPAGTALVVNSMCPPGGKVLESLTAVEIPNEAFNIFNIMAQEFNASAMTNDLRQGVMPFRAVKATEVVEASNTITSVFQGMAKNFEAKQITRELELAWMTTAQNWDMIDKEIFVSLFGRERGEALKQLSPEDVFANTVGGVKFTVYGISKTLAKNQDFQRYMTLLQTVAGSPVLMEEFVKKYDLGRTLGEIMSSLNIDKAKLEIPVAVQRTMGGNPEEQGAPPEAGPDMMSQIAPAGDQSFGEMLGQMLPQDQFAQGGGAV